MKIFKVIWKAWLQHRVYKYTLKHEDFSSKAERFRHLAEGYESIANDYVEKNYCSDNYERCTHSATKYFNKGDHYEHLANMYLNKKLDLEEKLQYYRKV